MANKELKPNFPYGLSSQGQNIFEHGYVNDGLIEHSENAVMTVPTDTKEDFVVSAVRYNDSKEEFEGAYKDGWRSLGGGGVIWVTAEAGLEVKDLVKGYGYLVDTRNTQTKFVLPKNPVVGTSVSVCDLFGSFSTMPLTVSPNGNMLYGKPDDMIMSTDHVAATFTYAGEVQGWVVTAGVGLGQGRVYNRTVKHTVLSKRTTNIVLDINPAMVDIYVNGSRLADKYYTLEGYNVSFDPALPSGVELQVIEFTPVQLTYSSYDKEMQLLAEKVNSLTEKTNNQISGFTFKTGALLKSQNDFIYDETTQQFYYWGGEFPKLVPAGSNWENGVGWINSSVLLEGKLSSNQGGDRNITTRHPALNTITRLLSEKNSDVISLGDFGGNDSKAIDLLIKYLETLELIKYRGTGYNTGGLRIVSTGIINVDKPVSFPNTRNLILDGWFIQPTDLFPEGEFLLKFPSGGQIDVSANENVSLRDVTLNCKWKASGLLLQDFTNVKADGLYVYKFHSYGVKTENVINSSHEFVCSNLQVSQRSWGEEYPSHITMGVGVSNGNADNLYNNIVIGYCKTKSFEVTGDEGGVKTGGGALFINQMHLYSGYVPMTIDSAHVYISSSYFDGDYIECSSRGLSVIGSFFQFSGSESDRTFIKFTSNTVGEVYISGNKFNNRNGASNIRLANSLVGKNIFSTYIDKNSFNGLEAFRVKSSTVASIVLDVSKWIDTTDGVYAVVDFPAYKGRKQITVESSDADRTKFFNTVRETDGSVRIYCWYVNGAGKAKPVSNVVVYSSDDIPPDHNVSI